MIALGDEVFLKACKVGKPGMVIRRDHGKLTVFWPDMDYWSRHPPEALVEAEKQQRALADRKEASR